MPRRLLKVSPWKTNNHRGIWQFVALEQVVATLVDCIEQRHELVTVPRSQRLVAKAGQGSLLRPDLGAVHKGGCW